jgi:hypothetical protein
VQDLIDMRASNWQVRRKVEGPKISEEAQRQEEIKGHLDMITPENYERIRDQIIAIDFSNLSTLRGLVEQVVDKALGEPAFCEICAQLCFDLSQKLPEFPAIPPNEETGDFGREKVTFRRELLNKLQVEFEEGAAATFAVAHREKAKAEVTAVHNVADERCGCSYFCRYDNEKNLESWNMIQGQIHIFLAQCWRCNGQGQPLVVILKFGWCLA